MVIRAGHSTAVLGALLSGAWGRVDGETDEP
jgi:hypothetical protein